MSAKAMPPDEVSNGKVGYDVNLRHEAVCSISEGTREQNLRSHDVQWFYKSPGNIPSAFRDLLVDYSHVSPQQLEEHLIAMRNQAWEVNPLPCIGRFVFIELHLSRNELYKQILKRTQDGASFLDIGCCLGQDIRKLIHDGAPAENIVGMDLYGRFFDIGYKLFRDSELRARFIEADILQDSAQLNALKQSFDIIHLGMFLHMFTWNEQAQALKRAMKLLKPVEGSFILGESAGHVDGIATKTTWNKFTFRHDVESFKRLMMQVSEETKTQWDIKADLIPGSGRTNWLNPNMRRFLFRVEFFS